MAGLTNMLYPNLSLAPLDKNRHKDTFYAKYRWKNLLEVAEGKFPSQYFNNISRLGTGAERFVPVADMVGESFLLRCLLEKEISEFCLVREILGENSSVVLKHQESDIISNFITASCAAEN